MSAAETAEKLCSLAMKISAGYKQRMSVLQASQYLLFILQHQFLE